VFSVVLPVVKTRFLAEAIDGILAQTHRDFELIVVDNAADGDVRALVDSKADRRISYQRHHPRLPIIENWMRCLAYATRPYFVLASDDDRHEPPFLAEMARLIARYPDAGLYHARARIVDENGNLRRLAPACPEFEDGLDFLWHRMARLREHFISDFCWPTEALRREGGFVAFPDAWFTDEATAVRHAARGGVACSPDPCFTYRESPDNLTSTAAAPRKLQAIAQYEDWVTAFLDRQQASGATPTRIAAIRAEMPRRLERMRYRVLLDPGGAGLGKALGLVLGQGRRYRVSLGGLLAAGMLGLSGRLFERTSGR